MVRKGIGTRRAHRSGLPLSRPGLRRLVLPEGREGARPHGAAIAASLLRVLDAVEEVNERQKHVLFAKLQERVRRRDLRGARVAVWGLAFKPHTDDMREAPALTLIDELLARGRRRVVAHDPVAMHEAQRRLGDTRRRSPATNYDALDGADALVVVTDWNEYRHPDFARIKSALRRPIIVDGRNLYDADARWRRSGFTYSLDRPRRRSR